ncbi:MAG: radical SAM family heme chaperone HemW [Bacillota bacterium]|nr:radical SAM family heme chaperone HemW [Bacillota bacterium]
MGGAKKAIGLYVHLPFCLHRCRYCDFVSLDVARWRAEERRRLWTRYVEAVVREAGWYARRSPEWEVESVYLGGGTPTLLPLDLFERLLGALRSFWPWREDVEVTVEANPGTLSQRKLAGLRRLGVNRLSLGAQSLEDGLLRFLGRRHSAAQVKEAVALARAAGWTNLSLDLIFAVPGQTLKSWQRTLEEAVALEPEHLSLYSLSLEAGTELGRLLREKKIAPCPDDLDAEMYRWAVVYLAGRGYRRYEISNFARPGREARHNLRYWKNEEYLGLGAGAWGYLDGTRYGNARRLPDYLARLEGAGRPAAEPPLLDRGRPQLSPAVVERECLVGARRWWEGAILSLRLAEGIARPLFRERYGVDVVEEEPEAVQELVQCGLLEVTPEWIRLSDRGFLLANQVFCRLLPG